MVEWLYRALQKLVRRFESVRDLHRNGSSWQAKRLLQRIDHPNDIPWQQQQIYELEQ